MRGSGVPIAIVRPKRSRQVWFVILSLLVLGVVPGLIALALAASGGTAGATAAGAMALLIVPLLAVSMVNIGQQWHVTIETVQWRRRWRAPQVWQREGLAARAEVTPRYHRGILVGRSRVLVLSGSHGEDRIDVGMLGPDGLTALVAALRPPRTSRGRRRRAVDERFEVDHDTIARYRRWRTRWRLIGLVVTVAACFAGGASLSGGRAAVGSMLVAAALVVSAYVVFSVAQQVVRRPCGPVPLAVRVTDAWIELERPGGSPGERHPWAGLAGVEISADLQEDGVLRILPRTGDPVEYSLTGRVGGDFRHGVLPELDELADALIDAGEQCGVPVVELQR